MARRVATVDVAPFRGFIRVRRWVQWQAPDPILGGAFRQERAATISARRLDSRRSKCNTLIQMWLTTNGPLLIGLTVRRGASVCPEYAQWRYGLLEIYSVRSASQHRRVRRGPLVSKFWRTTSVWSVARATSAFLRGAVGDASDNAPVGM